MLQVWEKTKTTVVFITHDVEEAVFLGDIVYVMTARPGKIKTRRIIDFERPRQYELKSTKGFTDVRNELLELIREESVRAI